MNRITLPPLSVATRQGGLYIVKFSDTYFYGGRAKQFRARWRRHLTQLERGDHPNKFMQSVLNKHQRFDPRILTTLPYKEQVAAEKVWLDTNFGTPGCLNLSHEPTNNTHVSLEARRKISAANKGRKQSPEAIRRSAESRRGMKQSPEARRNNSLAQMGKVVSPETRQAMSESSFRRGKPITEKLRAAIVASNQRRQGEVRSVEARAHLSQVVSKLIWVCREDESRRVPAMALPNLLDDGWQRGRKWR